FGRRLGRPTVSGNRLKPRSVWPPHLLPTSVAVVANGYAFRSAVLSIGTTAGSLRCSCSTISVKHWQLPLRIPMLDYRTLLRERCGADGLPKPSSSALAHPLPR